MENEGKMLNVTKISKYTTRSGYVHQTTDGTAHKELCGDEDLRNLSTQVNSKSKFHVHFQNVN